MRPFNAKKTIYILDKDVLTNFLKTTGMAAIFHQYYKANVLIGTLIKLVLNETLKLELGFQCHWRFSNISITTCFPHYNFLLWQKEGLKYKFRSFLKAKLDGKKFNYVHYISEDNETEASYTHIFEKLERYFSFEDTHIDKYISIVDCIIQG